MGQMKLFRVGPNQNRTPPWGWGNLAPRKEASKVSLRGHARALSASRRVGW